MSSFTSRILNVTKNLASGAPSAACSPAADAQLGDAKTDETNLPTFLTAQCDFDATGILKSGKSGYHYGVQLGLASDQRTGAAFLRIWAVHQDTFAPPAAFIIRTADGKELRLEPQLNRADIMRHLNVPAEKREQSIVCAANTAFDSKKNTVTLLLETPDGIIKVGTAKQGPPQVLIGTNNWLFLSGDSNDSVGQFTQPHQPSKKWRDGWDTYFTAFDDLQKSGGAGRIAFLIAPSKETIFPDYHPLPFGGRTLLTSLLDRHGDNPNVIAPVDTLMPHRELSYDPVETHWTDYGARKVGELLLKHWKTRLPDLASQYETTPGTGDLGMKVVPPARTERLKAAWPNNSRKVYDNFVLHHGRTIVFRNPKAAYNKTLLIFGGSSSEYLLRYFTAIFRKVTYVHSVGAWDPKILELEKPHFTIMQTSERFLTIAPKPIVSTSDVIAKKRRGGYVLEKTTKEERLERWQHPQVAGYHALD